MPIELASQLYPCVGTLKLCVVYLDPNEFHSTWLGNKAIYCTRMAMVDGGHLIILAPGVEHFGKDGIIDKLIWQYGYHGTPAILDAMKHNVPLQDNFSAVAHLIHGSSEGRFQITYCPGPALSQEDIKKAGFVHGNVQTMLEQYPIQERQRC